MYLNLGLYGNNSGGGGGPASPADIIQWLYTNDDGTTVEDRVGLLGLPVYTDVYCLAGAGTITTAAVEVGDTLTHEGTATLSAGAGVITLGAGTVSQISINGVLTFPCEEGENFILYDVTGNGEHGIFATATWTTSDDIDSYIALYGWSDNFIWSTEPTAGWNRTLNPNTWTNLELFNLISTMINDVYTYDIGTYTITEPTGGWLRTFNPQTATMGNFFDAAATLANELSGTSETYTVTAPTVAVTSFDPATDSFEDAKGALATLMIQLQTSGDIG